MNSELSQLIRIQEVDLEIKKLQEEIASLPVRQSELESQFAASVREYLEIKQSLDEALAARKNLESELETEQQKNQKFKDDLMKATNEREYSTAIREIDVTAKAISSHETEILKLMEKIEKLEAQVAEKTPEMEARRAEVDKQLSAWTAESESDRLKLDALSAERAPLLDALSTDARATYERLSKMKSGTPLAEARDYSCLACRMKIRPQVFNDIRRAEKIITCENCGRILYFK
ncbi:MAG: zinc ribbon domain-containing protein [Blastocatellales bacterium]